VNAAAVLLTLLPMASGAFSGYLWGHWRGAAKANRYHVDQKIRSHDEERARQLFAGRWIAEPGGDAMELLKTDPEEFFRLNGIWMETRQ
jgi:hypothetical protein